MLLSDGIGFSRLIKTIAGIALLGVVAGCQVRPLYSTPGVVEGKLASISISEADDRIEQQVRNHLVFLFGGGAGETQNAAYRLELHVTARTLGVLADVAADTMRAGRVIVSADYNLARADTGETVASGQRATSATLDFPAQEFAKLRAIREAQDRAARETAEFVRADVAAALARR